jgi:hypothetical protein
MTNIQPNRPFLAAIPEGYEAQGPKLYLVPVMAVGAALRYGGRTLTESNWSALLRRMRYAPHDAEGLAEELWHRYPNPLSFEEWADLFEQLAIGRAMASKYLRAR